ncbi:unnamed protein product [Trichogramma brassicae]|uniref:ascorbate ferrireductase (transmembrane) n=1 Tax=Trichogramma brassicae TaxID=86971 RepID=A0A6H5IDB5_9HYME|nr:unnamed protein product [Trichogramma brassicae]
MTKEKEEQQKQEMQKQQQQSPEAPATTAQASEQQQQQQLSDDEHDPHHHHHHHRHNLKSQPSPLAIAASVLTHLLLLLPVLYIVGLAFESYSFFSWHPICMSLGAGLVIMEAVYSISGVALISKNFGRTLRVRLHWILHLLGISLLIAGLVIVILSKNDEGRDHFVTTHSQLGLSTIVITCAVACFGMLANNAKWFYPRVRPVLLKVVHSYAGIGLTVLLLATVINGTYNRWWTNIGAGETGRDLVFASLFFAGLLVLFKPIIGAAARTRVLMKPRPAAKVVVPVKDTADITRGLIFFHRFSHGTTYEHT